MTHPDRNVRCPQFPRHSVGANKVSSNDDESLVRGREQRTRSKPSSEVQPRVVERRAHRHDSPLAREEIKVERHTRVPQGELDRVQARRANPARIAAEEELTRIAKEQAREQHRQEARRKNTHQPHRSVVSYSHLQNPASTSTQAEPLTYRCMAVPSSSLSRRTCTTPDLPSLRSPAGPAPRTRVSFEQVLSSMNGPLFPECDDEPAPHRFQRRHHYRNSTGPIRPERIHRQEQNTLLLEALLAPSKAHTPSSAKRIPVRPKITPAQPVDAGSCNRCSAAFSPASSGSIASSSGASRSWFSFRTSRSTIASSSVSTAATSPSTSPSPSSWLKPAPLSSLLSTSASSIPSPLMAQTVPSRNSCHHHPPFRIPISIADSPLRPDHPSHPLIVRASTSELVQQETCSQAEHEHLGFDTNADVGMYGRPLTQLVSLAKSFHTACINVALLSAGAHNSMGEASHMQALRFAVAQPIRVGVALNDGRRARKRDVRIFLSIKYASVQPREGSVAPGDPGAIGHPSSLDRLVSKRMRPIPLLPFARQISPPVQRTSLPTPLPYILHFKPEPRPFISPHRTNAPWRIREVGNPVCLRLRAAKNRLGVEDMVVIKEGRMHEGTEKLVSVAFDRRGDSRLGMAVRSW